MFRSLINRLAPVAIAVVWASAGLGMTGCSLSDIVGEPNAQDTSNDLPDAAKSPDGALAFYRGVLTLQGDALKWTTRYSGILTDELRSNNRLDSRRLQEGDNTIETDITIAFDALHKVRANARQGRGLLAQYAPALPKALIGHLYAIEAMADVALAELYCSGVPLSTVEYNGGVTPRNGSSTEDVYNTAIALFDSALTLAADSGRIVNFAKVGRARALVGLANYAAAAQVVGDVPDDYQYRVESTDNGFNRVIANGSYGAGEFATVSSEGQTGLPYATSADWRTDSVKVNIVQTDFSVGFRLAAANKYDMTGKTPIIMASGVEARLIEAEADLHASGSEWLTILNALRANCTPMAACSPVLSNIPTAAPQLGPLSDPGSDSARVTRLFAERAAWLYLTGHRQGDMRRLIRQYNRPQSTVYPIGSYSGQFGSLITTYGVDVTIPTPTGERQRNAKYTGCINRGA